MCRFTKYTCRRVSCPTITQVEICGLTKYGRVPCPTMYWGFPKRTPGGRFGGALPLGAEADQKINTHNQKFVLVLFVYTIQMKQVYWEKIINKFRENTKSCCRNTSSINMYIV